MPTTENDSTLAAAQISEESTETTGNYQAMRFNAMKTGILSRLIVQPHEHFGGVYRLAGFVQEHEPAGANPGRRTSGSSAGKAYDTQPGEAG